MDEDKDARDYWEFQGKFYERAAEIAEERGEDYKPLVKINYQNALNVYEKAGLLLLARNVARKLGDKDKVKSIELKFFTSEDKG